MKRTIVFLGLIILWIGSASAQTTDCPPNITFNETQPTAFAKSVGTQWEIDVLQSLNNSYCFFDKKPYGLDVSFVKNGITKKILRLEIELDNKGWNVTPIEPQNDWRLFTIFAPYKTLNADAYYKKIEPLDCTAEPTSILIKFDTSNWVNGGIAPNGKYSTVVKWNDPSNTVCYAVHTFSFKRIFGNNSKFNAFYEFPLKNPSNINLGIAQLSIDHDYSHQGQIDHFKLFFDKDALNEIFSESTQPVCQPTTSDPNTPDPYPNTCAPAIPNPSSPQAQNGPLPDFPVYVDEATSVLHGLTMLNLEMVSQLSSYGGKPA